MTVERHCSSCCHFESGSAAIEAALPGLSSLGSGYAAVRSRDGLCLHHERYLAAASECPDHRPSAAHG